MDSHGSHAWIDNYVARTWHQCFSFVPLTSIDYETKVLVPGAISFSAQDRLTIVYGNPWIASILYVFWLIP